MNHTEDGIESRIMAILHALQSWRNAHNKLQDKKASGLAYDEVAAGQQQCVSCAPSVIEESRNKIKTDDDLLLVVQARILGMILKLLLIVVPPDGLFPHPWLYYWECLL